MGAGLALGHLGYPDEAARLAREGIDEARALGHFKPLAYALWHATAFQLLRRDLPAAEAMAGELVAVARDHSAVFWVTYGCAILSCARAGESAAADSISQLQHDIEAMHALTAFRYLRPCIDLLAAEMLSAAGDSWAGLRLLAETQTFIEQWEQRLSEAEFHRVRAQLLLATGAAASEGPVRASDGLFHPVCRDSRR